jgi:signal transduction histidine kinase
MALALLFILLFTFFTKEKVNLLFGIFCSLQAINIFLQFQLSYGSLDIRGFGFISFLLDLFGKAIGSVILLIICRAVLPRIMFHHWIIFIGFAIDSLLFLFFGPIFPQLVLSFLLHIIVTLAFLHLSIYAFRQRNYIIGVVATNSCLLNIFFFFIVFANQDPNDLIYFFAVNFIVMTLYVSTNFARKSKNLEVQIVEIGKLSQENLKKEQEKQQMLASQNEKLEHQVKERTMALTHTIEELKSTQSQLIQSEKMASLGELTAGIAHEIQNPLNFVNNFSEVNRELIQELRNELNAGNKEEAVLIANDIDENQEKINHHGKRAEAIVKGMLQHSRSNSGQKEPTDINALADEYLRLAYHGLRAKDNSFNALMKTDFDETIKKVNIISQDIGRVLLNLYTNAFYAVNEKQKQGGENYEPIVSVSTKKLDSKLELRVGDNGCGIPQKVLDKIFQPFFTTKAPGQGTGLGLSLSYDIIKAHGGEIKVNTKQGEFAEFVIQLPQTVTM